MKQNELFNKCCENIDSKTREEVWKQMDKELGREENRGNSPKIPSNSPKQELEQKECIWDIPEDKRHCEFCTANCVNVHAVSTPTELEQAAKEYAEGPKANWHSVTALECAFKAGAEWMKKEFSSILDKWEEHAIRGMRVGASAYHQGKIALICDLRDWMKEIEKEDV